MRYGISKEAQHTKSSWDDGIHNAKVCQFSIGFDDHGFLGGCLHVEYKSGTRQGWGGFRLDRHDKDASVNKPSVVCGAFIASVLEITGSTSVHKVVRKPIRVRKEGGFITHIGHYLDDQWFSLKEWCDENLSEGGVA